MSMTEIPVSRYIDTYSTNLLAKEEMELKGFERDDNFDGPGIIFQIVDKCGNVVAHVDMTIYDSSVEETNVEIDAMIDILVVDDNYRLKGFGSLLMNVLNAYSDSKNLSVGLKAKPLKYESSTMTMDDLTRFYQMFGFHVIGCKDEYNEQFMYRETT